jgi:hypothetical protein
VTQETGSSEPVELEAERLNPSPDQSWLREAFERIVAESRLFFSTFLSFLAHPGRSVRDWRSGERRYMNPLAFAAAAAGVYWAITNVVSAVWPVGEADSANLLSEQITSAIGPYVHYGLLGIAMHLALLALGSRQRILGSIGAAFFVGGSIGTLTSLVLTSLARWYAHMHATTSLELQSGDILPVVVFGGSVISYVLICLALARALTALHKIARWKVGVAAFFAVVATAVLFGSVIPDGAFGWRPYIKIETANEIGFSFGFRG